MNNTTSGVSPKVVAIVSYLTLIGWIIALVLNNPRTNFASFHLRQSLGLIVLAVAARILGIIPFIGPLLSIAAGLLLLGLWILGLVSAIQEEQKPVPIAGEYFQDWFKGL